MEGRGLIVGLFVATPVTVGGDVTTAETTAEPVGGVCPSDCGSRDQVFTVSLLGEIEKMTLVS